MSEDKTDKIEIPELIDLPVYREDYISQQQVDKLCRLVWEEKPDFVEALVLVEKTPFPNNRSGVFFERMGDIIDFFRDKEKEGAIESISMIAMVDLTYEIDRRVRHALGLEDIKPTGEQIAEGPDGPFPPPGELNRYIRGKDKEVLEMPPERNAVYLKLYKEHPEVIFAYAELHRRHLRMGEPDWFLSRYFKDHLKKENDK